MCAGCSWGLQKCQGEMGQISVFLLALDSDMEPAVLGRCLPQPTTVSVVLAWPSMPELEVPGVKARGGVSG